MVNLILVFLNSFYKINWLASESIILLRLVYKYFLSSNIFFKRLNSKILVVNIFLTLLYKLYYLKLLQLNIFYYY